MIEIVIHGRGGQGAVTAAKILATAALEDGKFTLYRPGFFAAERQGAPVKAFVRIGGKEFARHKIDKADGIIILDPSLVKLDLLDVKGGLKENGWAIVNASEKDFAEITGKIFYPNLKLFIIDANGLALKHGLGKVVNTAILGVLAGPLFNAVSFSSLENAVRKIAPRKIEENLKALKDASASMKEMDETARTLLGIGI